VGWTCNGREGTILSGTFSTTADFTDDIDLLSDIFGRAGLGLIKDNLFGSEEPEAEEAEDEATAFARSEKKLGFRGRDSAEADMGVGAAANADGPWAAGADPAAFAAPAGLGVVKNPRLKPANPRSAG